MDESVVTRVMPNSIEAEQSVVGSMILDRQAIITAAEGRMISTTGSMELCSRQW